jgi:hypothetical protein
LTLKIHVCLVSDQTLANLIAVLMERPDRVVLVASAEMQRRRQDQRLAQALSGYGIPTETVGDVPDVSLNAIRRYAEALRDALAEGAPSATVTLNATGGTKLMMLGFVEAFRQGGIRTIYVDTAHRRVEEIGGADIGMENVLDVPAYLSAQGIHIDRIDSDDKARCARAEQRAELTRFIGTHVAKLQRAIKTLNSILYGAVEKDPVTWEERFVKSDFELKQGACWHFNKLLTLGDDLGLLKWNNETQSGRFVDIEAARYFKGIWLEEYAWLCARDCHLFDVRMGVHRIGVQNEELNEFDLLATHGNQLLYVECKTANYKWQLGKANQDAYKIDSLSRLTRGLFGETWLLSAIEPPQQLLDRARELRIRVLGPEEIASLGARIFEWMGADPAGLPPHPAGADFGSINP